jgi:hypothetical protein
MNTVNLYSLAVFMRMTELRSAIPRAFAAASRSPVNAGGRSYRAIRQLAKNFRAQTRQRSFAEAIFLAG